MNDPGAELVALDDVFFVSDGLVPIYEHNGVRFGVPFRVFEPGSIIHTPGRPGEAGPGPRRG